ncbi:hypothetical protein FT663_03284 [Candidozyma haemuli var. vulneris]|nr:hypothetical protein FT663_03284 [[Candida] haemuloni var. vulneris]
MRRRLGDVFLPQLRTMASSASSRMRLRDYQEVAVGNTLDAFKNGIKRAAVVLATGGGKTVVMAHLIPQIKSMNKGDKVLVLAHKQELVRQAANTILQVNPQLRVGIDMSTSKVNTDEKDVVVASVPTLINMSRLSRYNPNDFKAIFLDECHHATAGSWKKILNYFGALEEDSSHYVVGLTATLERADGISLSKVFQDIVFERNLITMIRAKELCDVRLSRIGVQIDWSKVRQKAGDFVSKDLSEAVNREDINATVAQGYLQLKEKYNFKSTLIFCVDIKHCRTLCGVLQSRGVKAQYVTGETVHHERQAILEDFRNGKIDVLCNVLVFTEGTDIPNIDSLILARPTRSRSLLIQMIGRGLRLHQQKDLCDVIDMADNTKFGVESRATLLGLEEELRAAGKSEKEIDESLEAVIDSAVVRDIDEEEVKRKAIEALETREKLNEMSIRFQTIEGFAELHKTKTDEEVAEEVNQAAKTCRIPLARLNINEWGFGVGYEDYVLRSGEKGFELAKVRFAPIEAIYASGFKIQRAHFEVIKRSDSMVDLILATENMFYGKIRAKGFWKRPISESQLTFLTRRLTSKARTNHDKSPEELRARLKETMSMGRASNLCIAVMLARPLWVSWELARMFGYHSRSMHRMRQAFKTVDKKKENYKHLVPTDPEQESRDEAEEALIDGNVWSNTAQDAADTHQA